MPVEFPIIIQEDYNTYESRHGNRFGWRFAYVNYEQFQLSIHFMDPGEDVVQLVHDPQAYMNMPLSHIYTIDGNAVETRDFYNGGGYTYWHQAISRDTFERLLHTAREAIAAGWLPQQENPETGEPVPFEICSDDDVPMRLHGIQREHLTCVSCEEDWPRGLVDRYPMLTEMGHEEPALCFYCAQEGISITDIFDVIPCAHCAGLVERDVLAVVQYYNARNNVCHDCLDDDLGYCEVEEHFVHWDDMIDDFECRDCRERGNNPARFINSWNFRPDLEFHPDIPTDPMRPLYIGMELEMTWPGWTGSERESASEWLEAMQVEYEGLLYAKSDSSVYDGFEVVTHPMEPQWALDNFPFQFFQDAINMGALETHDSVGTHIHIDKASLTTAQLWKILMLHENLAQFCGTVGGRGVNAQYASWGNTRFIKENIKDIAQMKGRAFGQAQRYVPVNVQNEQTIELRYMAGSIEPDMIKKNIEWVQALYDFTNYITVQDIKEGVLADQSYLAGWVLNGKYPSLSKYIKQNLVIPAEMPERTT